MWQYNYEAACLCHSFKGTSWKDHKYITKKNGKYIYPGGGKKEKTPEVDEEKEKLMAELQALREEKARRESASANSEASRGSDENESIKPDNDNG